MSENEFDLTLIGEGHYRTLDGLRRLRDIVSEGAATLCGELRKKGRPDRASRMAWISSQLRAGKAVSKRVEKKAARDLGELKKRLVDGVSVSGR